MIDLAVLYARLRVLNSTTRQGASGMRATTGSLAAVDALIDAAGCRLAVYGSLAPGEENAWVLDGLTGSWESGTVFGHLSRVGWGEALGYPGIIWDPEGPAVRVQVFTSAQLPSAWPRIDAFEGEDYRRVLVPVTMSGETVVAHIYEVVARD